MKPDLFALKATLLMSLLVLITWSCKEKIVPPGTEFACTEIHLGDQQLNLANAVLNKQLPVDKPLQLTFNYPLQTDNIESHITLTDASGTVLPLQFSFQSQDLAVDASPADPLSPQQSYTIDIASTLKNKDGVSCKPLSIAFETQPGQLKIDSIVSGGIHLIAPQPAQKCQPEFCRFCLFQPCFDNLFGYQCQCVAVSARGIRTISTGFCQWRQYPGDYRFDAFGTF